VNDEHEHKHEHKHFIFKGPEDLEHKDLTPEQREEHKKECFMCSLIDFMERWTTQYSKMGKPPIDEFNLTKCLSAIQLEVNEQVLKNQGAKGLKAYGGFDAPKIHMTMEAIAYSSMTHSDVLNQAFRADVLKYAADKLEDTIKQGLTEMERAFMKKANPFADKN
jgi:hypothetical protein